ncbi:trna (guanine-n-)-methyltransferase subunitwdr4 [Lichtheimia corymbifera JMRC:FSU:9682]|uniref:Trna (Guanine-n-)-methyltransferase subunitwdr4 n=1 Tax=Lichtheimia corymbifera JMRC:FSU:9682 TaxID=1263082 RepID=A0A068RM42_9FUNG|nr:trna (guanine-n-)-methyltransferase subunitwdr4 [Lichtheimia corymbifera JMRC:FSU:9682]
MAEHRIPFTKLVHSPTNSHLALANGKHFFIVDSSTGNVLKSNDANDRKQEYMDLYRNMAFSQDGSLLASAGEDKKINVYDANDWSLKYSRNAVKRVNAIQFNKDASKIVIADKFGDVFCHPAEKSDGEEEKMAPILGHVSMITDMTLSADEKYVVTADRDEHIRVSRFPNGYNIESFCLAHTDVVTSVKVVPWSTDLLVSAGGDNTVRVWQFVQGKEMQCFPTKEYISKYMPEATDANSKEPIVSRLVIDSNKKVIALSFAKIPAILLLGWSDDNKLEYKQTIETQAPVLDICFDLKGSLWASLAPTGDALMAIFEGDNFDAVSESDPRLKQVNEIQVGLVDKEVELYSIFGLRKLLDLPDYVQTPAEHKKNKKRKIAAE